jgi:hypothetical protein
LYLERAAFAHALAAATRDARDTGYTSAPEASAIAQKWRDGCTELVLRGPASPATVAAPAWAGLFAQQGVAVMVAAIVVPAGIRSITRMRACLVSGRIAVFEDEGASRVRDLDLLVDREVERAAAFSFDLGLVVTATSNCSSSWSLRCLIAAVSPIPALAFSRVSTFKAAV